MQLADLLAHPTPLPSSPRVLALLLTELKQWQPDLRRIDQFIKADPVLSLRVLQAANEPSLGLCGQVSSVSEALALQNNAVYRDTDTIQAATLYKEWLKIFWFTS